MKLSKQILTITGLTGLGLVSMFILNFFILQNILIPDPCYYHSHDTNKDFDLFYEMTANEDYHPTPTRLNLISTLTIGGLTG